MLSRAAAGLALAGLLQAVPARATYSIVATDRFTQQVGGAVTSCVGVQSVSTVYGPAPGHGGINAQAAQSIAGRNQGVMLLNLDVEPVEIIRQITSVVFDANARTRQYGLADLSGRAAGFTGAGAQDYKEDRQGSFDTYTYSAQGNILTGRAVLDQAEAAFRTVGCDLADKLMLALEAGATNGQGDSRCTTVRNIPSDSASIQVDASGAPAGSYLRLSLSGTMNVSPLLRLRTMFDDWRRTHPCLSADAGPNIEAGQRDASPDAATPETGTSGADATFDARDAATDRGGAQAALDGSGGSDASEGRGGVGGAGLATDSGGAGGNSSGMTRDAAMSIAVADGASEESPSINIDDGGCTCRAAAHRSRSHATAWGMALVIVAALVRRRLQRA
jgi:uncharacterized Ntn-hydrolase superfamily protein